MKQPLSVALIGLGEVGQILATDLAEAGVADIKCFDVLFAYPDSKPSRAAVPARKCFTTADAVAGRYIVVSAVTASSDGDVARAVAPVMARGAYFLDLNSVSPGQRRASAECINSAGGRYVEAAVMSSFPPKRMGSPMLLGGPHAQTFAPLALDLGFSGASVFSNSYGLASATKMCRSVMIKGIEALLAESLLSARHYGVESFVIASLYDLLPVEDWEKLATYMISRSLEHGNRRAEEMREVAETVAQAGIEPLMSRACAGRQEWAAEHRSALADSLGQMLDGILAGVGTTRDKIA